MADGCFSASSSRLQFYTTDTDEASCKQHIRASGLRCGQARFQCFGKCRCLWHCLSHSSFYAKSIPCLACDTFILEYLSAAQSLIQIPSQGKCTIQNNNAAAALTCPNMPKFIKMHFKESVEDSIISLGLWGVL